MSDLFIIGNGFDRAHGMETSYYDFHQFIKDNCKNMPYIGVVELVSQDSENKIGGMIVRGMMKTELIKDAKISTNAMAKLGKNEDVRVGVLEKICLTLDCKLDDILEFVPDKE